MTELPLQEASTRSTIELLWMVLSKDPQAAAGRRLSRELTRRTAEALTELGLPREAARLLAERMVPERQRREFTAAVEAELPSPIAVGL